MRRSLFVLVFLSTGFVAALPACKKNEPAAPIVDAAPPPPVDSAPAVLAPLDDDAGSDAGVDAGPVKHAGGPGLNTNQARAKQCCTALRSQAKAMGSSPEANVLLGFATQCDQMAVQLGPNNAEAPEFGALRAMLKGNAIVPPICKGL